MSSQVALVKDFYSAFVDDKETVGCFLLLHDMTPEPMLKAYPKVDFMSSGLSSQSSQSNLPTEHQIHQYIKEHN